MSSFKELQAQQDFYNASLRRIVNQAGTVTGRMVGGIDFAAGYGPKLTPQGSPFKNGKMLGLCACGRCGWTGKIEALKIPTKSLTVDKRKPCGLCPNCNARPRWRKTTDQQVRLLMP